MRASLKTLVWVAAALGAANLATDVASAAPMNGLAPALGVAIDAGAGAGVEQARVCGPYRCVYRPDFYGPRRFYGPYGYYRPRPVYRPYGFYGPRPFYRPYGY